MALLNFKAKTNNIKLFKANIHVLPYSMFGVFFQNGTVYNHWLMPLRTKPQNKAMQNTKRLESNLVFKTKQNKKKCVGGSGKTLTPEAGVSSL